MNSHLAKGLLVAWLSASLSTAQAQEQPIKETTNKQLIETINTPHQKKNSDQITFENIKKEFEIRDQITYILQNRFEKNPEIRTLKEKYGEKLILEQITSIVKTVSAKPEQFWSFDEEGKFLPDKQAITELCRTLYLTDESISPFLSGGAVALLVIILSLMVGIVTNKKTRK